ncbi:LysR family transcriptional regulator [Bradyrhizobium sp. U87765 SZCCT0131]|uniref:LysR family transcriptional regulator n=1 Tax=unclassified Bradyrhizobium TaxID=2631580 RepID=UPI001BA59082|nr:MULTISPECIES: LysR family transcriptional regulator [unclassified Bradyrhizobium]MBR1216539.1 LysR family transcriptional regulator [Bradyrhizobium sp. U87765 SZCCT0131]MBR1259705.1 LysR family transcriptional regulator [Bradyrhizobium sp. U87765 SZCCT0134]MBR1305846.1 LysR family transcriptional regulator [Bradyrhizobium sp. U87765 SZCCT0110]MBR1322213.1 LysR family transcriptional regulator [Bradyrhizobium sp. U87765 SZCCT0109]MBR1350508.1 LysR family transcriptional regulator [Bradyrhizo
MDLRHLRYFVAVAEEGSMTVAAEKRLHTAQPSLSRQMRDLETELGCELMIRGAKGVELTTAGRVLLDHARAVLLQVEAATEATRRASASAKRSFVIGFLTGYEFDWLAAVMRILRDELPNTEVVILSSSSPDLADGLTRGKIDLAFLRHERNAPGVVFTRLIDEPLIVLMPREHRLAKRAAITAHDIATEQLVGVPHDKSPALRNVTDAYGKKIGIDLTPDHLVDNLSMAVSLVASTGGIALMPLYARNLLPATMVYRPLAGHAPTIDLSLGYNEANTSPLLKTIVSRIGDLKFASS